MSARLDLVVLVADADAEWTIRTLLEKRHAALQIRAVNHNERAFDRLRSTLQRWFGLS